ncbi:hypothetical protein LTR86_007097 [Recurvomyces mirabilis]|nr:hypothetical protein LTR86_007097 [Recurvomyces mirabilis]
MDFLRRWDRMDFGAFERLVRVTGVNSPAPISSVVSSLHHSNGSLSMIEALPAEILGLVLAQSDLEAKDIINLGLCSTILWSHALSHIHRDVKLRTGYWAGQPLLCTGTYLTTLPEAIYDLLPEEKAMEDEYQAFMDNYHSGPSIPGRGRIGKRWYGPCPARRWNWNAVSEPEDDGFEDVGGKQGLQRWTEALGASLLTLTSPLSVMLRARLWQGIMDIVESTRATDSMDGVVHGENHWILRNLSKKQYFRLDLLPSFRGHGPQTLVQGSRWLSLDQALIMRIAWNGASARDAFFTELETLSEGLGCGAWAGHPFDVVCANSREHVEWMAEGEDVTEEIVLMAEQISKLHEHWAKGGSMQLAGSRADQANLDNLSLQALQREY